MAIWIKPNGAEVEVNDLPANEKKAASLGWKKKAKKKAKSEKE